MINLNEASHHQSLKDLETGVAPKPQGRFVVTTEAEAAIHGHEHDLVRAAGVALPANENDHAPCPYPNHSDKDPSFRLMRTQSGNYVPVCTCRGVHSIFHFLMYRYGIEFAEAKITAMELIGCESLIRDGTQVGLNLQQYADVKRLPIEFLRDQLGLQDIRYYNKPAVLIPYFDENGVCQTRYRRAMAKPHDNKKDMRFKWEKGSKLCLYGIGVFRGFLGRGLDFVLLCEGESNCQTAWFYGIPALGIPGSPGGWNETRDAHIVAEATYIYVAIDPDKAGELFRTKLGKSAIAPRIQVLQFPDGIKDISELHLSLCDRPGEFVLAIKQAMRNATPLQNASDVAVTPQKKNLHIGSDLEIANCVADELRQEFGDVLFDDGAFYRYSGEHWEAIDRHTQRRSVYVYDGAIFLTAEAKLSSVKLNKSRIDSTLHELRTILARPKFFDDAKVGINCKSGFIAFDADGTISQLPHDPDHRCRHVLPGSWQYGIEDPPPNSLLHKLLTGTFKGDPDINDKHKLVAEIAGAAATGYATKLLQAKAMVFKGQDAENGKSQILDMYRGLLPSTAISSVTASQMGDEKHIVALQDKLLNASDELSSAASIASGPFKAVITGEPVSGRDVYKSRIDFRSRAMNVFSCNQLPKFSGGMDRGVQRRLGVLEFNRVIPENEKVAHIGIRIAQEEPDLLLAFAVSGASRLIRQRGFTIPGSSKVALVNWIYESDPVPAWVEARVEKADPPQPGQKIVGIKGSFAYSQFKTWAIAEGFRERDIPEISGFVQRLKANKEVTGITTKHLRSGNWLIGLKILVVDRDPISDGIREVPRGINLNA